MPHPPSLARRAFRFMLRLLPLDFRDDFGGEMEAAFEEQHQETGRARGRGRAAGLLVRTMLDTLRLAAIEHWDMLRHDVRFGARLLGREPAFTSVAVLTLALGIGATTGVYAIVDAVVFRPLPFPKADRLVLLEVTQKRSADPRLSVFSYPQFTDVREQSTVFDALAAYAGAGAMARPGGRDSVFALHVSADLFRLLGGRVARGRLLTPADFAADAPRVAVISHGAAVRLFGSVDHAIGRVLAEAQSQHPHVVVGVMPPRFTFPYPALPAEFDAWLPLTPDVTTPPGADPRRYFRWSVVGRLKDGASIDGAQRQLATIAERLAAAYPEAHKHQGLHATLLHEAVIAGAKLPLLLFFAAVASALLIACANVANLLLARAAARQHEFAVRTALGAGRGRIVRQLLTETTLLSLMGGLLGVALAYWGVRAFVTLSPDLPRLSEAALDGRVVAFAVGMLALTTVVSGLVPAVQCSRRSVVESLARAGGTRTGRRAQRPLGALVVAELAIALVLLVGGGLMANSFVHLLRADLGFDPTSVVAIHIDREASQQASTQATVSRQGRTRSAALDLERRTGVVVLGARDQQVAATNADVSRRLDRLPGVVVTGLTTRAPFPDGRGMTGIHIEGRADRPGDSLSAETVSASPGYFRALQVALVAGRFFDERDREGAPRVAVVNEALARVAWGKADPIGKGIAMGYLPMARVVGVVRDGLHEGPNRPPIPELYFADAQEPRQRLVVVRTQGAATGLAAAIAREVRAADPGLTVGRVSALEDLLWERLRVPRFITFVLGAFSLLALALALVGVHGVLAYSVAKRTREIGVRMALGGTRARVLRLVLGQAVRYAVAGVVLGLAGGIALGRVMRALLFQVAPTDPVTLGLVSAVLLATVVLAAGGPAVRAMRVDPMACLKDE